MRSTPWRQNRLMPSLCCRQQGLRSCHRWSSPASLRKGYL